MKKAIEPQHFPFFDYTRYTFSLGLDTPEGVWLSGHTASRYDPALKRMVVEGNIVQQARTAYEKVRIILEAVGLGFRDVVRTVDYVPVEGLADYPRVAELRREVFGDAPPATSTVAVRRLLRPEALIEIEVLASRGQPQAVSPGWSASFPFHSVAHKAGGVLHIPSQLPVRPGTDHIVGEGDIGMQARQIYENAGAILRAAGLGWQNVVKTVEFLTPDGLRRYKDTAAVRKEYLDAAYPASTGVIMPRLAHPGALLQVDFVAAEGHREAVNPGWARYKRLTYVPAVRVGKLLFLSGQGAVNEETSVVEHPGDIIAQTRSVYSKISRVLEAAGAGLDALVQTIEFVTPAALEHYASAARVRQELMKPPYPAATGPVCERLLRPQMLIEVDAVALLD